MQPLRVEKVVRPVWWRVCWGLLALIAFVPAIVAPGGNVVTAVLAYGLVWGLPVQIALLTLYSRERYGRITVTADELRVGRERLPLRELDPAQLEVLARTAGAGGGGGGRQVGGAYARTLGTRALVLRRLDGERLAVETRTPGELAATLLSARSALTQQ